MGRLCLYFVEHGANVKMSTTGKVDSIIRRMGRSARNSRSEILAAIVVGDRAAASKLRRVLLRHWVNRQNGAGIINVSSAELGQVVRHLELDRGLECYGGSRQLSARAQRLALQRFARGRGGRWRSDPEAPEFAAERPALDELLAAGAITEHRRRSSGEIEYRGSRITQRLARKEARSAVPRRGRPSLVHAHEPVIEQVVVPEPYMARELLLGRMEEAEAAGEDPFEVLHRQAYKGALRNMRLMIGALADVKDLTEAQKAGASRFRLVAEHGQLGGARAIDYEVTKVDTSIMKDAVLDIGAAARAEYDQGRVALEAVPDGVDPRVGAQRRAIAEKMIVEDRSVRQVAADLGWGQGGAARGRVTEIAREAATILAREYGYVSSTHRRLRADPAARPEQFTADSESDIPTFIATRG